MAEFSISDVAFTGFRVVRENVRAFLIWVGFALGWSILLTLVGFVLLKPTFDVLTTFPKSAPPDTAHMTAFLRSLFPGLPIVMLIQVALGAIVRTAMNRIVLAPRAPSFAFFALGPDEVRQIGLSVLSWGVMFLFYIGLLFVLLIPTTLLAGGSGAMGFVSLTVAVFGVAWLAVRLSLASPLTFESRKVNLFGSFALTRGRFWPIFGTYALLIALAVVVLMLITVIAVAVGAATFGDLSIFMKPHQALADDFTFPALAQTLVSAVFSALVWPLAFTPPAVIYQAITRGTGAPALTEFA